LADKRLGELTALERSEQVAEWIRLAEEREEVLVQVETKPQGGRPEGGIRQAAREIGVERNEAQRAAKIDSLTPEAKAAARDLGLDEMMAARRWG
jgi:hypothetical protein